MTTDDERRAFLRACLQKALVHTQGAVQELQTIAQQSPTTMRLEHAYQALHALAGMAELDFDELHRMAGWGPKT
jgi:hypothetical protein